MASHMLDVNALLTAAMRAGMKLLTFDRGLLTLLATPAEHHAHIEVLS